MASYSVGVMEYECLVSLILAVSSSDNYDLLDTLISCSVLSFKNGFDDYFNILILTILRKRGPRHLRD